MVKVQCVIDDDRYAKMFHTIQIHATCSRAMNELRPVSFLTLLYRVSWGYSILRTGATLIAVAAFDVTVLTITLSIRQQVPRYRSQLGFASLSMRAAGVCAGVLPGDSTTAGQHTFNMRYSNRYATPRYTALQAQLKVRHFLNRHPAFPLPIDASTRSTYPRCIKLSIHLYVCHTEFINRFTSESILTIAVSLPAMSSVMLIEADGFGGTARLRPRPAFNL